MTIVLGFLLTKILTVDGVILIDTRNVGRPLGSVITIRKDIAAVGTHFLADIFTKIKPKGIGTIDTVVQFYHGTQVGGDRLTAACATDISKTKKTGIGIVNRAKDR